MHILAQLPADMAKEDRTQLLAVLSGLGVTPEPLWSDRQLKCLKREFRKAAQADNRNVLWAALSPRTDMMRVTAALAQAGVTDIQFRHAKLAYDLPALRALEA
jgi:hypothetical protein